MSLLQPGRTFTAGSGGRKLVVHDLISSGGQGEVYRASHGSDDVALKWIHTSWAAPGYFRALEALVQTSAPDDRFLWPYELVADGQLPGFGYLMPLREARFRTVGEIVAGEIRPPTSIRARAGREITAAFRSLHAKGFCYRDVSDDNVAIDPATGEVRIYDNDNVAVDGHGLQGIAGTPGWAAPEIVRGAALPSTDTDLFSLSVLLFHLLFNAHPLEGAREAEIHCKDREALLALHGRPVFIYDPCDASNRPVPGLHDGAIRLWPFYTQRIRDIFTRAFTAGLTPGRRVRGNEWRDALIDLEDSVQRCVCGAENVYDSASRHDSRIPCWRCHKRMHDPLLLRFGHHDVVANIGKTLYPHHCVAGSQYDFSVSSAEIERAGDGGVALRNCSGLDWQVRLGEGKSAVVRPAQRAELQDGLIVDFGSRIARVG